MKNINSILYITAIAGLGLASCSPGATAMRGESDDLYFMASDAAVATEFAVQNNTPKNFREVKQADPQQLTQENFSAKNVNPEYIARYQRQDPEDEGSVYFDESGEAASDRGDADVNVYNNFYGQGAGNQFNRGGFGMNPWMNPMMMGMGGFGMMNPWMNPMMGGFGMMNPWMMDPWMMGMGGFGMRPGFGMSVGMGFGFNRFGMGFGNPWMMGSRFGMMGMGGFGMMGMGMGMWDPFWGPGFGMMGMHPMMGFGRFGMMGMHPMYGGFGRPLYVLPGGEFGQRQAVRGARATRGSGVAAPGQRGDRAAAPTSSRAAARRDAVGGTSTPSSRVRSNDFNRSQNDLYSDRARTAASAAPSRRAANSPAMNRAGSATNRNAYTAPRNTGARAQSPASRTAAPTNRTAAPARGTSPSYNRSTSPSYNRGTSPAYNRTSPARTAPTQRSAPAQRSSPSYSAPSRGGSMGGGGGSVGGGSRGGGGGRGGR